MRKILALFLLLGHGAAFGQVTFTASVTNANGSLTTALNWSSPAGATCVGAGHPAWNGDKAASGTQTLPAITLSGTYSLTISCSTPGVTTATVSWTPPTTNTDNTPLTNLAGFRVVYGTSPTALNQTVEIANPLAVSRIITGLTPGTWFFAVRAYNSLGVESDMSNVVSKVTTAARVDNGSVSLTVNPIPNSPSGLTVE